MMLEIMKIEQQLREEIEILKSKKAKEEKKERPI